MYQYIHVSINTYTDNIPTQVHVRLCMHILIFALNREVTQVWETRLFQQHLQSIILKVTSYLTELILMQGIVVETVFISKISHIP